MRYVEQSEIDMILSVARRKAMSSYRNYCILVLMTDYGMKIIDIINLQVNDIDWKTGIVSLRRKEKKYRTVQLKAEDLSLLRGLLFLCREFDEFSWLFCSYQGNKLSNSCMIKMMKAIAQKSGVELTTKDINATYIKKRVEREDIAEVARDLSYCSAEYLKRFLELD